MCGPGPSSAPGTAVSSPNGHLGRARHNGLTETELKEMIIHLAFYAGWPRAMSAISLARELLDDGDAQ
jgi:4-carboxymuconolactone decarboxylase